jgi:hypothetical protein
MLLFIYIGVISKNNLKSNIMKKVVLTLGLAFTTVIANAQREFYAPGVYIDSTEELGSFENPYIVDMYLDAEPYVWFYQEGWNEGIRTGKGMYGLKEDMIEYAENIIKEIVESEINLNDIKNKSYFIEEITAAKEMLEKHKTRQFLFIKWKNQKQIDEQNTLINKLIEKGKREREAELKVEQTILDNLKLKLKKID